MHLYVFVYVFGVELRLPSEGRSSRGYSVQVHEPRDGIVRSLNEATELLHISKRRPPTCLNAGCGLDTTMQRYRFYLLDELIRARLTNRRTSCSAHHVGFAVFILGRFRPKFWLDPAGPAVPTQRFSVELTLLPFPNVVEQGRCIRPESADHSRLACRMPSCLARRPGVLDCAHRHFDLGWRRQAAQFGDPGSSWIS